jgi:cellulose biosynthesis protein BcsQ
VKSALTAADLVLIPVQPSGVDLWGARAIVGACWRMRHLSALSLKLCLQ